jgi:hypothetical protein
MWNGREFNNGLLVELLEDLDAQPPYTALRLPMSNRTLAKKILVNNFYQRNNRWYHKIKYIY